ncbi:MAG: glycogen/starch/alpha-glucan family phosphorylase [Chlamydiia bacterium]|nr:glycogen/starch/alpha-glucan family phosphorylase [Chlamydiia bacterium]
MEIDLDYQAEKLMNKTKHYLITTMGRTSEEANAEELYRAFCYALREEIMINWLATERTFAKKNVRKMYYLSLEYMPGRFLSNNITNICATDLVQLALVKLNRDFNEILRREHDPGLGNGGLGRLASCFMDSLATHHYPARGYGLRYQYGIFEQQLWNGKQVETPDPWLMMENPWEFRRDMRKAQVQFFGTVADDESPLMNFQQVSALPFDVPIIGYSPHSDFSVATLRLWSTKESPRNFQLQRYNAGQLDQAAENTLLTDVLYPNDVHDVGKRIRLKQEFLLVSASIQDIIRNYLIHHEDFSSFADKVRIQINDTHPALVVTELVRLLIQQHHIPWEVAVEMTRTCTSYTNHTILSEALEKWDHDLLCTLLPRQCQILHRFNDQCLRTIREHFPNDSQKEKELAIFENNTVKMANLAIFGSHKINGVAALHTKILTETVFKDFYTLFPERFVNVTNGVTQRRWLLHCNPELAQFITERIGDGWITNFEEMKNLTSFASDPDSQKAFLAIKQHNKQRLIDFLKQDNFLRDDSGEIIADIPNIDPSSLFDVQIKRIHEYKRQLLMILHLIILSQEIREGKQRQPRTFIMGGKAAAGYDTAKDIIRLFCCVARSINADPLISQTLKAIYVENYNVSKAEMIIPAADLSEQISTAGMEASGTGNMKLTINGALTIGTDDGANIEMKEAITEQWWPFRFGASANDIATLKTEDTYSPRTIVEANSQIQQALNTLTDRTFAQNDQEHQTFSDLYHKLMESHYGGAPDRYFTLLDLEDYIAAQRRVDELYQNPNTWAEYCLHNIAGMGPFSTDNSIKNYADKIWNISPCQPDPTILAQVRDEYSQMDRCRIY